MQRASGLPVLAGHCVAIDLEREARASGLELVAFALRALSTTTDSRSNFRGEAKYSFSCRMCPHCKGDVESVPPNLSAREIEVLGWTAAGKTADVIAQLLNLRERTVNYHIAKCIDKLGASNKTHAVAKAMLLEAMNAGVTRQGCAPG